MNNERQLSKAQENLLKLPAECFGMIPSTRGIISITAGEMGYKPVTLSEKIISQCDHRGIHVDQLVDEMNAEIGVTKAQREAMQFGAMWGWGIRLANPDMYDEKGVLIRQKVSEGADSEK